MTWTLILPVAVTGAVTLTAAISAQLLASRLARKREKRSFQLSRRADAYADGFQVARRWTTWVEWHSVELARQPQMDGAPTAASVEAALSLVAPKRMVQLWRDAWDAFEGAYWALEGAVEYDGPTGRMMQKPDSPMFVDLLRRVAVFQDEARKDLDLPAD